MSASHFKQRAASPGAELLQDRLEGTPPGTRIPINPARGVLMPRPNDESVVGMTTNPQAAGIHRESTASSPAGGILPVVQAKKWDCSGLRPDFYTANCPGCRSTIKVAEPTPSLDSVNVCKSCGTGFFASVAV